MPFIKDSFSITVIAPNFSGKSEVSIKDINVIRIPMSKKTFGDYNAPKFCLLTCMKEIKKADIVWTHTIGPIGISAIISARLLRKPLVSFVHSIEWELFSKSVGGLKIKQNLIKIFTKIMVFILYNLVDLLLVPSEDSANLLNNIKIKTPKLIVKLGVNYNYFKPCKNKNKCKELISIDPKKFVIGFCGRIAREKDPLTLLRAFKFISKKYENMVLLIVGDGLKEYINLFKRTKNVIWVGKKDDTAKYYQAMDIFCSTSLTETTGLTILEAMSCEIPVITTNVGIANEIIKDYFNGMIIEKKNYYMLAKAIELLYKNEGLRKKIGVNARKTIINNFSWEKTSKEIKKALLSLV